MNQYPYRRERSPISPEADPGFGSAKAKIAFVVAVSLLLTLKAANGLFAAGEEDRHSALSMPDDKRHIQHTILTAGQSEDAAMQHYTEGRGSECQPFTLEPLSSLTVNTEPVARTAQGLTAARPADCASYVYGNQPVLVLDLTCARGADALWPTCCAWQFCHRPLYFEERELERYGCRDCCVQPGASALHFYCNALLLPARMVCQPCCYCSERTPCY